MINLVAIILLSMPCVLGYNVLSGFAPFGEGTAILDLEDFIVSNNLLPLGSLSVRALLHDPLRLGLEKLPHRSQFRRGSQISKMGKTIRDIHSPAHRHLPIHPRLLEQICRLGSSHAQEVKEGDLTVLARVRAASFLLA